MSALGWFLYAVSPSHPAAHRCMPKGCWQPTLLLLPMLRVHLLRFPAWLPRVTHRGAVPPSQVKARCFLELRLPAMPHGGALCSLTTSLSAFAARATRPIGAVKAMVYLCHLFSGLKGGKGISEPLPCLLSAVPPELEWGWLINMIHCCLLAVRARVKLLVPAGLAFLTRGLMHFALGNSDTQHHALALPHE